MNRPFRRIYAFATLAAVLSAPTFANAQFVDHFDRSKIEGWMTMVGDGTPTLEFFPRDGAAVMKIDGSKDAHNVWWTLIKRNVAPAIDVAKLQDPVHELRVEARVRSSHAPRRVNFMINTQRTTDFHEHLREYDLADTGWHTISMTTKNLDARPGDQVFVQLAAPDFGAGQYEVEIDYYRADVVDPAAAGADVGEPLVYHPPVPDLQTFRSHLGVAQDSVIHSAFPRVNFDDWTVSETGGKARVLTVQADHGVILRWDFGALKGSKATGPGVLELTTQSVQTGGNYIQAFGEDLGVEFGKVRVIEILGGDERWEDATVTFQSFLAGNEEGQLFNSQMTFDTTVSEEPGSKTYVVLSRPVIQRLLDGKTKGLVLKPLGAITAAVYSSEDSKSRGPVLHFTSR